ncbi:MAG TPA: hypothetical protein VM388_07065 [Acidimicrobiales bacterium]|nr:hypothetical protein [Acidimicrobiales bacterium]
MSEGPRRNNANQAGKAQKRNQPRPPAEPTPAEFWKLAPKAAAPTRITPATDPTALVRSLGKPPLDHPGADRYLASVAQRAAGLATALAVAADILAASEED